MSTSENQLPGDPIKWVKDLESIWQSHDGKRAAEGYTDDATMTWGTNQSQSGQPLRERPAKWFEFAKDLEITKEYIAHTNDCIVTTWNSNYTDPETGQKVFERGIEYFYFREGKVCSQHAWQHSWQDGDISANGDFSTD